MDRDQPYQLLKAGLSRNVILICILCMFFHNTGGRGLPRSDTEESHIEVAWVIIQSVAVGLLAPIGVGLQLREYFHYVHARRIEPDWLWVVAVGTIAAVVVALFAVAWPVMFVGD